jgi:hypothetical protein
MNPFQTLDEESLLDSLTVYYTRYRNIIETNWNQEDFDSCRDTLFAILHELNKRKGLNAKTDLPGREDYLFERKSS